MSGCHHPYVVGTSVLTPIPESHSAKPGLICSCPCHNNGSDCWCKCKKELRFLNDNLSIRAEIDKLKAEIDVLRRTIATAPFKCPICEGECGYLVSYEKDIESVFVDCKACKGKGVIWKYLADITDV